MISDSRQTQNIDEALTREPERDLWADHDEPTEATGTATRLILGKTADSLFAGAHAAAAALREARRSQRAKPGAGSDQKSVEPKDDQVGYCARCRHYVVEDGWHAPCGGGTDVRGLDTGDYYERLAICASIKQPKRRNAIPAEWRELPNYPGYVLHSVTRELWRQAREVTLPNGSIRRYGAKEVKPANGTYSLSVNGVRSTRGIQALWDETFPEGTKKKKQTGEIIVPHRSEFEYYRGIAEWLGEGGAGIVTRPK